MKMKEEKQQQVPVWRLVLSSHAHQQQSPKQLQQPSSSSSSSWSLISSGHFSSCSPEPGTVPLFPRLRFIEAKSTAPLITGSQTPHQDTSVVDEAMENINRISKPKENVQPKVRDSSPQLEQCSRDGLKGRSPRKRGILTDNFELCNSSIAALKRRKNFEVPLAKQSGVGSLCQVASISPVQISSPTENIRINQEAPLLGDPQNLEQQHVFASSCLFQTASGKSVPISNAAMNRAVALIGKTSGRSEIGWNGWTKGVIQSADLKGESIRMNLDVNQCGSLHDNMERKGLEGQNAGSLYQSANGKAISISNSGMNKAMAVFDEIGSLNSGVRRDGSSDEIYDAELNNGSLKMGSLDRNRNASPCEFDRSGISNNVIDNACLKNCSLRMGLLNKKVNAHPHGGLSDSVERKSSEGPNGIPSSCLFQTANGNALSISNVGMGQALSLFGDEIGSNFEVVGNGTGNKTNNDVDLKCDSMRMCFSGEKVSTHQSGLSDVIEQQNVAASLSLFQNSGGKVEYENEINSGKLKDGSLRPGEKVGSCGSLSDNIERQISKEPSVENLKDVSLRTGLPIDKLRTHHPNGDTYGDISDDIEKKYLEEQNVVASSCLFQTSGGTAVSISNARLGKVMSFFGDEAGSNSEDGRNRVYNDATYAANFMDSSVRMGLLGDKESTQTYGDIFNDIERNFDMKSSAEQNVATSSCLFQTASGKAVSISNAALNQAITLFGEKVRSNSKVVRNGMNCDGAKLKDGSLRMGLLGDKVSIHPYRDIFDDVSIEEQNVAASPCLFQTASGKAVSISNAALNQAAALFGERLSTNAEVQRNEMNNCQVDNINIKNGSLNCEQTPNLSMFYTGQGQPVSISSSAMKQAAKRLGQEDHCFAVDAPLASPSMTFMTVKGQSISVSRSAMKRARNLLAGESDEAGVLMTDNVIKEGHLIRVSNDSIERAKVLLGDSSANKFNTSKSTKTRVALDYSKVHEFTPPNRIKSMPVRKIEESNVSSLTRKGQFSRKYFKAPRRVQPELAPKATSSLEPCIQASRTSLLQLVKVYPVQWKGIQRCSLQEFFMQTPHQEQVGELVTRKVKSMTAETSKYYKFSTNVAGIDSVGSDEFRHMLLETGASRQFATKEWVDNHFRWIVWKLASLERSYPTDMGNKLLTIQTVFDELRYRYEREVNRAHRSALKRITEGDALAGTGLVLCIVAIGVKDNNQPDSANKTQEIKQTVDAPAVQIEITDGWYSIIGQLDQPLVRQVLAGKIFVGQKLRICGASLIGCTTPMPPLEAYQTMKLALHINGTYRAHWADKLGFCKRMPMPIAFHCIKHDGGLVPRTIIGINRIYPVSYYEKLPDHKSIIRCARGEELAIHNYQHRRNQVAEAAFMRMEKEDAPILEGNNMGEGAKLFHALETAAEPELLMADMTAAQLAAFATYQTKREAARQALVEKNIHKALGEVHLDAREVTPFIEINVMGLVLPTAGKCNSENEVASEHQKQKSIFKGGIVTVWQVTEEQVEDLKEGAVYCVSDLYPLVGNSSNQDLSGTVLHLRATKLTKWRLLPRAKFTSFSPRSAIEISSLGTIPFGSEFDVAVLVVHVGRPYAAGLYKKQWLFVSDGSVEENPRKNTALLAINISTTSDAFLPVERSMEGCIVGYCNLVKQRRDQRNCLWVAESSKSSVYTINLSSEKFSHLRNAATKVDKWAKTYGEDVAELQRRIQATLCGVS